MSINPAWLPVEEDEAVVEVDEDMADGAVVVDLQADAVDIAEAFEDEDVVAFVDAVVVAIIRIIEKTKMQ